MGHRVEQGGGPNTVEQKRLSRSLAKRAENADPYLRHQMSVKSFVAADALSVVTESTAFNSEGEECEESDDAFNKAQKEVWSKAAARDARNTNTKAPGTAGVPRGNPLGRLHHADRSTHRAAASASSPLSHTPMAPPP